MNACPLPRGATCQGSKIMNGTDGERVGAMLNPPHLGETDL